MLEQEFQQPKKQEVSGVLLIFFKSSYRFIRAFWPFLVLAFVSSSEEVRFYSFLALPVLGVLGVIYSFFYYRNFTFYIDYKDQKFVLEKGVFSSESIRIPFDKIQQVDLKRSILQRLIKVYGLNIDTAGSKKDEIHIHALQEKEAKKIAEILTHLKNESFEEEESSTENTAEKTSSTSKEFWKYQVSLFTLIKIGLTRSYLRGFLLIFVFASSIYNQVESYFSSYLPTENEFDNFYENVSGDLLILLFSISFIFLLSILVTIGEVVIRHFNLNLKQNPKNLEIEMGLKTNTKVSFQAKRLQVLKIITNPIQKKLNLFEAQFFLASSQNDLGKSKIITPGLGIEILEKVKSFLYTKNLSVQSKHITPHLVWINRRYILIGLGILAVWILNYLMYDLKNIIGLSIITAIILLVLLPYQYFLYKTIKLSISEDFLVINQGLWTQKTEIIELFKMEGISVQQPFWYKRRGLYNITFHTAGGGLKMRAMSTDFLKDLNYMLYKIESSTKAWM